MAEVRDRRRVRPQEADGERPTRSTETGKKETLLEKVMRTRKQLEDKRGSYFAAKEGQNRVRIMPSWRGVGEQFYIELPIHRNVGPDDKFCTCLQYWGDPCPIDTTIERLANSESARDQQKASDMMADIRFVVNVGYPNEEDGIVKPWQMSGAFFLDILGYFGDPEYGDFTDPRTGYDFIFTRTGTGLRTRYTNKRFAQKPSRVKIANAKSKLINLDTFPKRYTRKQLRAMLNGEQVD